MANEYMVNASDVLSIANAIREKGGITEGLAFPDDFVTSIESIPVGGGLNFTVIGGTTQPENPVENTIWVDTDQEITSWVFSADEPAGSAEGMVWFPTGVSSPGAFNALKNNGIEVYPLSAKQYMNGAWSGVAVAVFCSGEWTGLERYLYNSGNECTDITGGWKAFQPESNKSFDSSACIKQTGYLMLKHQKEQTSYGFGTQNPVDLTPYRYVEFEVPYLKDCCGFGVTSTLANAMNNSAAKTIKSGGLSNAVVRVDVSKLTGSYRVWFGDWHTSFAEEVRVSAVRLV